MGPQQHLKRACKKDPEGQVESGRVSLVSAAGLFPWSALFQEGGQHATHNEYTHQTSGLHAQQKRDWFGDTLAYELHWLNLFSAWPRLLNYSSSSKSLKRSCVIHSTHKSTRCRLKCVAWDECSYTVCGVFPSPDPELVSPLSPRKMERCVQQW